MIYWGYWFWCWRVVFVWDGREFWCEGRYWVDGFVVVVFGGVVVVEGIEGVNVFLGVRVVVFGGGGRLYFVVFLS